MGADEARDSEGGTTTIDTGALVWANGGKSASATMVASAQAVVAPARPRFTGIETEASGGVAGGCCCCG